mmetsp:Transcript_21777/g.64940  ORF Transcript_21777/g.64940 Transcript_21777/m.64940 type:complete len:245 (+) Transcript_21777:1763-2497(+)
MTITTIDCMLLRIVEPSTSSVALNLPNLRSLRSRSRRSTRRKPRGTWIEPMNKFSQKGKMEMASMRSIGAMTCEMRRSDGGALMGGAAHTSLGSGTACSARCSASKTDLRTKGAQMNFARYSTVKYTMQMSPSQARHPSGPVGQMEFKDWPMSRNTCVTIAEKSMIAQALPSREEPLPSRIIVYCSNWFSRTVGRSWRPSPAAGWSTTSMFVSGSLCCPSGVGFQWAEKSLSLHRDFRMSFHEM